MTNSSLRIRYFSIIVFLVVFNLYQELLHTIASPLGAPASVVLVFIEVVVFLLLVALVLKKIKHRQRLARTPLDWLIAFFILSALISILINRQFTIGAFNGMRVLLRYVALFYIVVNIRISTHEILRVYKIIIVNGVLLGILSALLYLFPQLNRLLLPRTVEIGNISILATGVKIGAVAGTFSVPAETAIYFLLVFIVYMVFIRSRPNIYNIINAWLISPGIIIFGIFTTYKRFALLLVPVTLALIVWYKRDVRGRVWLIISCLAVLLGIILFPILRGERSIISAELSAYAAPQEVYSSEIDVSHFLFQVFTPDYWRRVFTVQRGWTITKVGGHMFTSGRIFGYGPDTQLTRLAVGGQSQDLARIYRYTGFEDAYWIAMLTYFGIVGLGLFLLLVYRAYGLSIWLTRNGQTQIQQQTGLLTTVYIVIYFLDSFVERIPEIKAPSFFFWLLIGLVVNQYLKGGR